MPETPAVEVPALDLTKTLNDMCLQYLNSEAGRRQLQTHIEASFAQALKQATASYSPFAKALEETIERALKLSDECNVASYNDAVLNIVKLQMDKLSDDVVQRELASKLQELLQPPPAEIKLSDFIQSYLDYLREEAKEECVCGSEPYTATVVLLDDRADRVRLKDFRTLYLSEHPVKDPKHESDIEICFHKSEIFRLRFRSWTHESRLFENKLYGFSRSLFQMKVAGTKFVPDIGPDDIKGFFELDYGPDNND